MSESEKDGTAHRAVDPSRRRLMQVVKLGILLGSSLLILIIVTAIAFLVSYYEKLKSPYQNNTIVAPNNSDYGERSFTEIENYGKSTDLK